MPDESHEVNSTEGSSDDLVCGWNSDSTETGIVNEKIDESAKNLSVLKFQPGDHVIRWKIIKLMLWPIQVHGIVLQSNVDDNGDIVVVIADFGYSSNQSKPNSKGRFWGLNDFMNKLKRKKDADDSKSSTGSDNDLGGNYADDVSNNDVFFEFPNIETSYEGDDSFGIGIENSSSEEIGKRTDQKRFHLRTITDPNDLKKWSKVNYGGSLFSPKGKLDKLKKIFKIPHKKSDVAKDEHQSRGQHENSGTSTRSGFDGNDECSIDHSSIQSKNCNVQLQSQSDDYNKCYMNVEHIIKQANESNQNLRIKLPFEENCYQGKKIDTESLNSSPTLKPPSSVSSFRRFGRKKILKKISFRNLKPQSLEKDQYASISTKSSEEAQLEKMKNQDEPKLPKSDPRKIVLARVQFILDEQEKDKGDLSLPAYHILYSNSECLAVWCKTGKFSTLQAAVFLHSTAVGNAKSTFMLSAGVAATQPWLLPVVGVYGLVAVGMPYYMLKKCKDKWKQSEQKLTHGFWERASNDVLVCAIENWSGLTPDKEENSDEK